MVAKFQKHYFAIAFFENHCLEKSPLVNLRAKWHQICVFVRPYGVLRARHHYFIDFAERMKPALVEISRGGQWSRITVNFGFCVF